MLCMSRATEYLSIVRFHLSLLAGLMSVQAITFCGDAAYIEDISRTVEGESLPDRSALLAFFENLTSWHSVGRAQEWRNGKSQQ